MNNKIPKKQAPPYRVPNFINLMIAATLPINAKMLENLAVMSVPTILCAVLMVVVIYVFMDTLTMLIVTPVTIYLPTQDISSQALNTFLLKRFTMGCKLFIEHWMWDVVQIKLTFSNTHLQHMVWKNFIL